MTIVYYIFVALMVIGGLIYLRKDKIWKPNVGSEIKDKSTAIEPVMAMIYDCVKDKFYKKMIDGETQTKIIEAHPKIGLGRKWCEDDGKKMHNLCLDFENNYIPEEVYLVKDRENPPLKLHGYLSQPEVAIAKDINVDKGFMEKYGHYMPYILAILFLVFMMVMQ